MSDDLTLPGDLPGLLRYTSPLGGDYLTVLAVDDGDALVVYEDQRGDFGALWESLSDLRLDLTDPTGRVHAAWWAWDAWRAGRRESLILPVAPPTITEAEEEVLRAASLGRTFTDAEIATLRDLCLRLGGRTP